MKKNLGGWMVGAVAATLFLVVTAAQSVSAQDQNWGNPEGEWRYWGADQRSSRYTSLDQITAENFEDLEVAWIWRGDNFGPEPYTLQRSTPIYADGTLYTVAGERRTAAAIDPATGETLWIYREPYTERWERSMRKSYGKGVAYGVSSDGDERIFLVTPGFFLHALDAETGRHVEGWGDPVPIEGFPETGTQDLLAYFDEGDYDVFSGYPEEHKIITSSAAPMVVNGTVVVGNSHEQGYRETHRTNVPGDILAFDVDDGSFKWRFDVIPEPGQFGHDSWESDAWQYTGNVSSWAPMSADPELGLVYAVTDGVTIDYYGGFYPGDNLFATSIIALDIETGERVWHYQTVHHDIWNYDNPTAPNLLDVTIDGEEVPIIVQTTKQGFAYVLNRETGEPVWPIPEVAVPQSRVPGEQTSPTQPIPTRPAPYEMTGLPDSMVVDFTPEIHERALENLEGFSYGPVFNPPINSDNDLGIRGSLHCPGGNGGTNIPGGTVADPANGVIYVASIRSCSDPALVPGTEVDPTSDVAYVSGRGGGGYGSIYVDGIPPWKPPYGSITAIDMNTGEHLWKIPNSVTPPNIANHPLLEGVDIGNTGRSAHATALATPNLLIWGEGRGARPLVHAGDKATGEILATVELPAPTNTAPMSYSHEGKQYLVFSVGGGDLAGSHVALTLP